jgi:hypothetical protein
MSKIKEAVYGCTACGTIVELKTNAPVVEPQVLLCRVCKERTIYRRVIDAPDVIAGRIIMQGGKA